MNAGDKYRPYFKYLEVNVTIEEEKPPKIFFNRILGKMKRLDDSKNIKR